ncbi:peptidase M28 [Klebsiella pneumoniae]|uniref:Peptidase M28 n=1 Tax=Klebsiella pneumoniae TaxID=573 RepID=A0A3S4H6W5_KLEPN|nr:peptidase M28 [Klebsiella pneumoniae]
MFSALCRRLLPLALGTGFVFAAAPAFSALGDTASSQAAISPPSSRDE